MKALGIINKCIEKIENMTQEEFDFIVAKKNIDDKIYNAEDYIGGGFSIVLPKKVDQVNLVETYAYNTLKSSINTKLFSSKLDTWNTINYTNIYLDNIKNSDVNYIIKMLKEKINNKNRVSKENLLLKENSFIQNEDNFLKAA